MELQNRDIDELLTLLGSWTLLSSKFKKALHLHMEPQKATPKRELDILSRDTGYAWFSIDCWVAEYQVLFSGKEEVYAIYGPKQIFTDINSFLKASASNHRFLVISGSRLLAIERHNFSHLRSFRETGVLLEHYLLQQREKDNWRLELMSYPDHGKVEFFATKYPINGLPNKISASFLRMTPSRFSAERSKYNRSH